MVTIGFLSSRTTPIRMKTAYAFAAAALAEGAGFVFFWPGAVDFERRKVNGYTYDNGKWKRIRCNFPDIIYDAVECVENSCEETISRLRSEIPFTNPSDDYRRAAYESLMNNEEFSSGIIQTNIRDKMEGEEDIARPYINCSTKNGFAYDLRLYAQKGALGEWVVTEIYPRISVEGRVPKDIHDGGLTTNAESFLKAEFGSGYYERKRQVIKFLLKIAAHLDTMQNEYNAEEPDGLGMNVIFDKNNSIFVSEIEICPGFSRDLDVSLAAVRNSVCYSIYLAKKTFEAGSGNRIIFLGTHKSGSSLDAIAAAKSLGLFTVLLTDDSSHIEKREDFACVDRMRFCMLEDLEEIRREISLFSNVCAIVSFTEDHCLTASIMAKEAGLVYFTPEAIRTMQDKIKTRYAIKDTPYSPYFCVLGCGGEITETQGKLPLIIKEPTSSGSKGVIRVDTREQLLNGINEIRKRITDSETLIEEYLDGQQFLVETLTENQEVHIIAIIEQEISWFRRYIVTGYKVITAHGTEFFNSLKRAAREIIKMLKMEKGPCHLEMKYVNGNWKLIEANPRISGAGMNLLIETAYGINLAMETLKMAMGQKIDIECRYRREAFAQYVTVEKEGVLVKATGRVKARKCEGVVYVYIKPRKGQLLIPPLSMGNRYACVIATGKTSDEAMTNAKRAAKEIVFYTKEIDENIWKMLPQAQRDALDEIRSKPNE